MKKIISCISAFVIILMVATSCVFAIEKNDISSDELISLSGKQINGVVSKNKCVSPMSFNPISYSKRNVKRSVEWGAYYKVSGIVHTGKYGGSITATKSETFGVSVSGSIYGLGISTSKSITTGIGHTINIGPYKRAYMAVRTKYKMERGIRVVKDSELRTTISTNKYTVAVPIDYEYRVFYR